MATTLVTQSMLLDLEAMTRAHAAFADRLNALLDALAVPPHGQGRAKWLVKAAGIQPVAAGKWFTGTKPRRSNLTTLAAFITANYPVNATQDELLDYLTGKYVALDVNAELARSGLTPPPATPMLPSSICMLAHDITLATPVACWVMPMA